MTPFEAYKLYMAVKMHFTQPSYDFFKYNGKTNANQDSYNRRRDKYQFQKLAKHRDPVNFLVANFISSDTSKWVGDLFSEQSEQHFTDWLARSESISYRFAQELSSIEEDFLSYFKCKDGQHPKLLTLYKQGKVSIETLTILNQLLSFFPIWDKRVTDTVIWPSIRTKCIKYQPFLKYDKKKLKSLVKQVLEINRSEA